MPPDDQLPPPIPPDEPPAPAPTPPPPMPPAQPAVPPFVEPQTPPPPPPPNIPYQPTAQPHITEEQNRQAASARLSPIGKKLFQYIEFDEDEQLLAEIRKHPIGLIFLVVTGSIIALIVAVSVTLLAVNIDKLGVDLGDQGSNIKMILIVLGLLIASVSIIVTVILTFIYRSNVVFVTNEKIAEVVYKSIFNRQVTQLSIGNVEDVTVEQKGILPRLFDYGTLVVETAGETENVTLTFVPNPSHYSQIIIKAHEDSIKNYGN